MGIKKTLKDKLFNNEDSIEILTKLEHFIFPDKQQFIDFLNEEEYENQLELSRKILLRLSFDFPFSPPNKFILNIFELEAQVLNNTKDFEFIGRDHYIHLINLYLLGIYVFFYHSGIKKELIDMFCIKRNQNCKYLKKNDREIVAIKDFIYCWKIFILFHDIGYPWELIKAPNRKKYLKPFKRVNRLLSKEITLRIMSRVISSRDFILRSRLTRFKDDFHMQKEKNNLEEMKKRTLFKMNKIDIIKFENYHKIPKLKGRKFSKFVINLLSNCEIFVVLEDTKTAEPVAFILKKDNLIQHDIVRNYDNSIDYLIKNIEEIAFTHTAWDNNRYSFSYYVKDIKSSLDSVLFNLFDSKTNVENFTRAHNFYTDNAPLQLSMLENDEDFDEYSFYYYDILLNNLFYDEDNDIHPMFIKDEISNNILRNTSSKLISEVVNIIENQLLDKINQSNKSSIDLLKEDIIDIVVYLFSGLNLSKSDNSSSKSLPLIIEKKIHSKLKEEIKIKVENFGVYDSLKKIIYEILTESIIFIENELKDAEIYTEEISNCCIFNFINKRIKKYLKQEYIELLDYKPDYIDNSKGDAFYDHGVAASLLLTDITNILSKLFNNTDNSQQNTEIAKSVFDLPNDKKELDYKTITLNSIVASTIAIHNLYPKYLKDKEYRTDINKDPFTYFSILCDSLQPWDRKRLYLKNNKKIYNTYSKNFNINISDNIFYISETSNDLSIHKRYNELKAHLDDFLKNGSHLIKLNLGEYV